MALQTVFCVGPCKISGDSQIMLEIAPVCQSPLASLQTVLLIPKFKNFGFLADLIIMKRKRGDL